MKIQQIRNAMVRIRYAGKTFLTDPWLAPRAAWGRSATIPCSAAAPNGWTCPCPLCDLPMPVADILTGVDAYIVTHVHPDHIDMAADGSVGAPLDKAVPVFVQSEEDAAVLRRSGFARVEVLGGDRLCGHPPQQDARTPRHHHPPAGRPAAWSSGILTKRRSMWPVTPSGSTVWPKACAVTGPMWSWSMPARPNCWTRAA